MWQDLLAFLLVKCRQHRFGVKRLIAPLNASY